MSLGRLGVAWVCAIPLMSACSGVGPSPTPVALTTAASLPLPAPSSPRNPDLVNWKADATVVSRSSPFGGCGWGTMPGETRAGVWWRITIEGNSILLDEDMDNWPTDHIGFSGTLSGRRFTASYDQGAGYERSTCQFKGATITGTFSDDFATFEADETVTWGAPGAEMHVERRWTGSRL